MMKIVDGKVVVYKSKKNTPPLKTIKTVYSKIPDDKNIPIVFETKKQYVAEYVKNQEKERGRPFPKRDVEVFKKKELKNMDNVVSRYTTKHNPYMEPRTVFFTDYKLTPTQFKKSALHEYGHEEWEKNKPLRIKWGKLNTKAPTGYGKTDKQEDFAESYMLHKEGMLRDPSRSNIIQDVASHNREKQLDLDKAIIRDMFKKVSRGDPEGIELLNKRQGMHDYFEGKKSDDLSEFDVNHDGKIDDKDITIIKKDKELMKELKRDDASSNSVADAIGLNVPAEWQATSSWKLYGAPKSYDPRIKETANLKGNLARITGEHYRALGINQPNAYNVLLGNRWLKGSTTGILNPTQGLMPGLNTDQYSLNLSLIEAATKVGTGLGKAAAFTKQRLSKENIERTYRGQERPHFGQDSKIRITKPVTSGLKFVAKSVGVPVSAAMILGGKALYNKSPSLQYATQATKALGSSASTGYAEQKAKYDKQLAEAKISEGVKSIGSDKPDAWKIIGYQEPDVVPLSAEEHASKTLAPQADVINNLYTSTPSSYDTSIVPFSGPSISAISRVPQNIPQITKQEYSFTTTPTMAQDKWFYT